MSDIGPPIVHTPYDLGLGFQIDMDSNVTAGGDCLVSYFAEHANLVWQLNNAPMPFVVIQFEEVLTLRVLDETWLSTETDHRRWKGIDGSFARTVKGGVYPTSRDLMGTIVPEQVHYQFVTGSECVDVIAQSPPKARLIDREEQKDYLLEFPKDIEQSD